MKGLAETHMTNGLSYPQQNRTKLGMHLFETLYRDWAIKFDPHTFGFDSYNIGQRAL